MKITESELFEALREAMNTQPMTERPSDAFTTEEIAEALQRSIPTAGRLVRTLYRAGRLEVVRVPMDYSDGRRVLIPAYRLKSEAA